MVTKTDKLLQFFEQLKTLTFWQRLFKWAQFRSLSYEAYEEFRAQLSDVARVANELETTNLEISVLKNNNEHLKSSNSALENDAKNLQTKFAENANKISDITSSLATKEESLRQSQDRLKDQIRETDSLKEKGNIAAGIIQELNGQIATKDESLRQGQNKLSTLDAELVRLNDKLSGHSAKISELTSLQATKDEALRQAEKKLKDLEIEVASHKEKLSNLTLEHSQLKKQDTIYKQTEDDRKSKYENDVAVLNSITSQIQEDRRKEFAQNQKEEIDRLNQMKETWAKHQENVKNTIKLLCDKHTIQYVDKVPFKGSPDNTISICDEFVVFDAKSPAGEDLNNFPLYIKAQTEGVKKYVKEDNVKKDIFLVIPSNTVDVITKFSFNMADYNVFIVTIDALEPIILSLKKIEDYEYIEQLSPEERDNICRVIGKFAHLTKRRIQIDQFFERQFLETLSRCDSDLPHDVLDKVVEYERSEKFNPPVDKRAKLISVKELELDSQKIRKEAEAKAIIFPASLQQEIKSLPLYNDEQNNEHET